MTVKKSFYVCALLATSLIACKKDNDDNNNNNNSNQANDQDRTFVMNASMSNRAEVELGNMALQRAQNQDVRNYGQMMVTEHTQAQNELQTVATNAGLQTQMDAPLSQEMVNMRNTLLSLQGRAFDSAYSRHMVTAHQMSIQQFQAEVAGGQHIALKNYAQAKLPILQTHLQEAIALSNRFQ